MKLPDELGRATLKALRDVAQDPEIWLAVENEPAFETSLLRSIPPQTVVTQFRRIVAGLPALTPYRFSYTRTLDELTPDLRLEFGVHPQVMPPTNVHVLIGANGVGKSSLLRDFARAAGGHTASRGAFHNELTLGTLSGRETALFANVVHVAFSAFDRQPLQPDEGHTAVHSVGLANGRSDDLDAQFSESLARCSREPRRTRWLRAVDTLAGADGILSDATPGALISSDDPVAHFAEMSSGHKIVLLTMTRLVELAEEQSLVLIDEPETHLHPPLLSALTRAISDLLNDRNGVAIFATHSPVVLQEVPRSCAWMLQRSGEDLRHRRSRPRLSVSRCPGSRRRCSTSTSTEVVTSTLSGCFSVRTGARLNAR